MKSKLDYLQKYLVNDQKQLKTAKTKKKQKQSQKDQLKIYDLEQKLNEEKQNQSNESDQQDEIPQIIEGLNTENLTQSQKMNLLKHGQLSLKQQQKIPKNQQNKQQNQNNNGTVSQSKSSQNKSQSSEQSSSENSSSESDNEKIKRKKKRHDSGSDEDDPQNGGAKNTLNKKIKKKQKSEDNKIKKSFKNALEGKKQEESDSDLSVQRRNKESDSDSESRQISEQGDLKKMQNNFQTVFRDKEGRVIDLNEQIKLNQNTKQYLQQLNEEQMKKWQKGYKQQELQKQKQEQMAKLSNEQFANYQISKEQEIEMMQKPRIGDTMGILINEEDKKLAEVKQTSNFRISMKCKFPSIPNRFNIQSGYRWDGVDRGNGFENKQFREQNQRIDRQQKAHEYATLDL